jgi:aldehyde:ferredoxin oxidoreductase
MLNDATGLNYDEKGIIKFAHRVETLSRLFNIREGWTIDDDVLPQRFWEGEKGGPADGIKAFIDHDDFKKSRTRYYELMGWGSDGVPKKETLDKLGLNSFVAY